MPISAVRFGGSNADDIHLVWGDTSRDLRANGVIFTQVLPSGDVTPIEAFAYAGGDVDIEFRPSFLSFPTATHHENFGIRVDKRTGVVSFIGAFPPSMTQHNFIVEVVVTRNTGGIDIARIPPAPIRVHVHPGVRRLWMTPNPMTVRRLTVAGLDFPDSSFTLRAEFTDDTVGDITLGHGVVWSPSENVIDVDPGGGRIMLRASDAVGATVPITATWKSLSATGNVVVAAPWANEPAMPKAELVDGHPDTWAGTINPQVVPNVLIFGDGFIKEDVPKLETIANGVVHDLKTDPLTKPYDVLATSMNFWRVAVPAPARGTSVRCEVYTFDADGRTWAWPLPPALPLRADRRFTLSSLFYEVGLPIPADVLLLENSLREKWFLTMRDPPAGLIRVGTVPDDWSPSVAAWKRFATRTFIDEIDGFPAMALGNPPRASEQSPTPMLALHPNRDAPRQLQAFFPLLRAGNNITLDGPPATNALGNVWLADKPAFHFDSRALVVIMAAIDGGRPQQIGFNPLRPAFAQAPHIAMSLEGGNHRIPVAPVAGRHAMRLNFVDPFPASVSRDTWRTIAHEMGHSFGLGDEYVDLPGNYTAPESSVDEWGNLTTEAAVTQGGVISANAIKWNWHRARKGAFITGTPTIVGGNLVVPVAGAGGFQFAVGDPVFLRQRQWKKVIGRAPVTSPALHVAARDPSGNTVILSGAVGGINLATFGDGSVVYVPVRDPANAGAFLTIVASKIARFITDNKRPLTTWPCAPDEQLAVDAQGRSVGERDQVPEYDGHGGFWSHRNDTRTIGLYSGGAHFGCGIFHPAGQCMMRNSDRDTSEFCHVCRFVLVEMINPTRHFEIDTAYDKVYPK